MARQSFASATALPKPALSTMPTSNAINPDIIRLAQTVQAANVKNSHETIKVGTSLSFVVYLYEQVRNVIDNKSDHLLRRNAIERILRRLLWENTNSSFDALSSQLAKELVWSGYLPNNTITLEQSEKLASIIEKYSLIIDHNSLFKGNSSKKQLVLAILSAEIEETLDHNLVISEELCMAMEHFFTSRYDEQDDLSPEKKQLLQFVAIRKVLVKSDNARIIYQLIKLTIPGWETMSANQVKQNIPLIRNLYSAVTQIQSSPFFNPLYRLLNKHAAQFLITRDIFQNHPDEALHLVKSQDQLKKQVLTLANLRYEQVAKTISGGIIKSIIYILASKVIFILLLEIPYELIVSGHINFLTLIVNLALPPLLMLLVGLGIPRPGSNNSKILVDRVIELVYPTKFVRHPLHLIEPKARESVIFNALYVLFAAIVFAVIVLILYMIHFNFLGILVFFLFLSLVLLFGFRVSFAATALYVEDPKKNAFSRLFEQITLPLLNLGVILSKGLERLNFLTIIMDVLFEMPLKTIVDIINRYGQFVGNKRAEIIEVPIQ